jgi:hypothetical protein
MKGTLSTYENHGAICDNVDIVHPSMFFLLPRDRFLNDFRNVFIAGPLAHHISEGDLVWIEEANLMKNEGQPVSDPGNMDLVLTLICPSAVKRSRLQLLQKWSDILEMKPNVPLKPGIFHVRAVSFGSSVSRVTAGCSARILDSSSDEGTIFAWSHLFPEIQVSKKHRSY